MKCHWEGYSIKYTHKYNTTNIITLHAPPTPPTLATRVVVCGHYNLYTPHMEYMHIHGIYMTM